MAAILRKLFRRKKQPPLVCAVNLDMDHDADHVHTAACFMEFEPLAVVELFQSQGCQSCPPAIPAILEGTAANPNLVLLTYNVSLFDHLGWKDTFANSQWDARQRAYVRKWGRNSLFTPMVVANGAADGPGAGGKAEIDAIVGRARDAGRTMGWSIYVDANDTDVRIDSDKPVAVPDSEGGAAAMADSGVYDVLVAVYNPESQKIKVAKGVNKGKKIEHRNVVTALMKIGEWRGGTAVVPLPTPRSAMTPGQEAVVIVQMPGGGPIVGAAKL